MKREFSQDNFEDFLKRSADSLRMKASEKVWQNLSRELNKRRRRFIFGLSAFLLIASTAGFLILTNYTRKQDVASLQNKQQSSLNLQYELPVNKKLSNTAALLTKQTTNSTAISSITNRADKNPAITSATTAKQNQSIKAAALPGVDASSIENNFASTIVDSYTEFDEQEAASKKDVAKNERPAVSVFPLTIESVINSYKAKNRQAKIEKQVYFSPTVSYRKLSENKSYLRTLDPANITSSLPALYSSVNNNVTHKPDLGFELGFVVKLPLSNKLKLRTGIQFNINRYDVKAFNSPLSIATIALNNGSTVDSLSTVSSYSNVHGYKSNWLQNFSFQVSAPIGIEYTFTNNDKVQFGIASTIQPTYVLNDRAYLITTDYKSYTQVPWLIRNWNVNTSLETFVKYKSWQFGPQVRYQLLSSFISKYPVKENLFDFGLKVGVTLK